MPLASLEVAFGDNVCTTETKVRGLTHGFEYHARRVAIVLLRQFDVFRAFRVSVILFVFCDWSIVLLDATERASGVGEHQPAGNSRLGVRMLLPSGRHRERSGPGIHIAGLIVVFNGRQSAFNVAFSMWFVCGFFLLMMKGTIEKDAETASTQVEAEIVRSPARERSQIVEDNNV